MAMKKLLDMRDPFDAMRWAFVCICWQGGRRSGELVRSKKRTGARDPKFDMHRGRLQWDWDGSTCKRARIALAPDKTDPTGEQGHKVLLPYAQDADINAAAAIAHMMALDPSPSGESYRQVTERHCFVIHEVGGYGLEVRPHVNASGAFTKNAASCLHLPTAQRANKASQ